MKFRIVPAAAVITAAAVMAPAVGVASAAEYANRTSPRAVVADVSGGPAPAAGSMLVIAPETGYPAPQVATVSNAPAMPKAVAAALDSAGVDPAEVSHVVKMRDGYYQIFRRLIVGEPAQEETFVDGKYTPGHPAVPGVPKLLITGEFGDALLLTAVSTDQLASLINPARKPSTLTSLFNTHSGKLTVAALDVIGLPLQVTTAVLVAIQDVIVSLPEVFAASNTAAGRWNAFTGRVEQARSILKETVERSVELSVGAFQKEWHKGREDAADRASHNAALEELEAAESASSGDRAPKDAPKPRNRRSAEPVVEAVTATAPVAAEPVAAAPVVSASVAEAESPKVESPKAESSKADSPKTDSVPTESSASAGSTASSSSESAGTASSTGSSGTESGGTESGGSVSDSSESE